MHRRGTPAFSDEVWELLQPWETRLDESITGLEDEITQIRRHLHAHPEPSGEETETSKFLADRLVDLGLQPRMFRDGLGLTADFTVGTPSPDAPLIAVRGDIDALRIPDQKTVGYASQVPGVSHACGHDVHASILLGSALACRDSDSNRSLASDEIGARIRLLFQPAEESCVGAHWMVEQDALDGVDTVLGMHVDPERPVGEIGVRYGVLTANCDEVEIVIDGHGGHAARPHHTVDPVAAAAHLISTLYNFLPRTIDSRHPAVFSIGEVNGGYAPNVIPEYVTLRGSLRTTDPASRAALKHKVAEICKGAEHSSGAEIHLKFQKPLKAVDNAPRATAALEEAAQRVVGAEQTERIDRPSMGGEDFSVYLDHVPGSMIRLGCAADAGEAQFLHSPLFDVDERVLGVGMRVLIRAAMLLSVGP